MKVFDRRTLLKATGYGLSLIAFSGCKTIMKSESHVENDWQECFFDSCTDDWTKHWFLDGSKARLSNSGKGMDFFAGSADDVDSCNAVLWTKQEFQGDLKIEYEYTRLDNAVRGVNIIYVQASGSGQGPYKHDILQWAALRTDPAMYFYFDHMNTYHISYAAFEGGMENDYIRARRYIPETEKGLKGTELINEYHRTGLFRTGVPHKFLIVKRGNNLSMHIRNEEKELYCEWENKFLPPIYQGRIGLRHMCMRGARYKNFRIYC